MRHLSNGRRQWDLRCSARQARPYRMRARRARSRAAGVGEQSIADLMRCPWDVSPGGAARSTWNRLPLVYDASDGARWNEANAQRTTPGVSAVALACNAWQV